MHDHINVMEEGRSTFFNWLHAKNVFSNAVTPSGMVTAAIVIFPEKVSDSFLTLIPSMEEGTETDAADL